jgi:hypothetical protein
MSGDSPSKQTQCLDWLIGGGVALAALGLYMATLAPTVLEADGGEFQFVPWLPVAGHCPPDRLSPLHPAGLAMEPPFPRW